MSFVLHCYPADRNEESADYRHHQALARIKLGRQEKLCLGNLDAKRDWRYARDYMEGVWLLLRQQEPDDYIIATGETHSVRDFLEGARQKLGWRPKVKFRDLVRMMVDADLQAESTTASDPAIARNHELLGR